MSKCSICLPILCKIWLVFSSKSQKNHKNRSYFVQNHLIILFPLWRMCIFPCILVFISTLWTWKCNGKMCYTSHVLVPINAVVRHLCYKHDCEILHWEWNWRLVGNCGPTGVMVNGWRWNACDVFHYVCKNVKHRCSVHKFRKQHMYGYSVQESTFVWESVFVICRR
jgi:hypothetical protein